MKTFSTVKSQAFKVFGVSAMMSIASAAYAATPEWTMNFAQNVGGAQTCGNTTGGSTFSDPTSFGNYSSCTSLGTNNPTAFVTAWSTTGTPGAGGATSLNGATNDAAGIEFEKANLVNWGSGSGFGVRNQAPSSVDWSSPDHSTDNAGQIDMIMLAFNSAVVLDAVQIGWKGADSDISLYRWTGNTAPLATNSTAAQIAANGVTLVEDKTVTGLASAGWALVGNYFNLAEDTLRNTNAVNGSPAPESSSYWLISAYNGNGLLGAHGDSAVGANADTTADYVKILSVSGSASKTVNVPEPGSLALMGAALAGMVAVRRRKEQTI